MKREYLTYELGMCVNPAEGHETFSDLAFKELDFVVHAAHVLASSLCWHDQSGDYKLAVAFLTSQDGTRFDLTACVRMGYLEELRNDLYRADNSAHAGYRLERRARLHLGLSLGTAHTRVLARLPVARSSACWLLLPISKRCARICRRSYCSSGLGLLVHWHLTIGNKATSLARLWWRSDLGSRQIDSMLYLKRLVCCMVLASTLNGHLAVREELLTTSCCPTARD